MLLIASGFSQYNFLNVLKQFWSVFFLLAFKSGLPNIEKHDKDYILYTTKLTYWSSLEN